MSDSARPRAESLAARARLVSSAISSFQEAYQRGMRSLARSIFLKEIERVVQKEVLDRAPHGTELFEMDIRGFVERSADPRAHLTQMENWVRVEPPSGQSKEYVFRVLPLPTRDAEANRAQAREDWRLGRTVSMPLTTFLASIGDLKSSVAKGERDDLLKLKADDAIFRGLSKEPDRRLPPNGAGKDTASNPG